MVGLRDELCTTESEATSSTRTSRVRCSRSGRSRHLLLPARPDGRCGRRRLTGVAAAERHTGPLAGSFMPRHRGLGPRLLAAVARSEATSAFAAERQVVSQNHQARRGQTDQFLRTDGLGSQRQRRCWSGIWTWGTRLRRDLSTGRSADEGAPATRRASQSAGPTSGKRRR